MDEGKALTFEEAKRLCRMAFDGGVTYGTESMRYGCNATAYDWEHWLKRNELLFMPAPTVEDVLREFTDAVLEWAGKSGTVAEVGIWSDVAAKYAAKLRLADDGEEQ